MAVIYVGLTPTLHKLRSVGCDLGLFRRWMVEVWNEGKEAIIYELCYDQLGKLRQIGALETCQADGFVRPETA